LARTGRRGLRPVQRARAVLPGPQDLFTAAGANAPPRHLWAGLGGMAPPLYNLHWTRPLRPARFALSLLEERRRIPRPLRLPARALSGVADTLVTNGHFDRDDADLREDELDAAAMLAHLPVVADGSALQPEYDARSLAWLLAQTARKARHGILRARSVLEGERLIGWYLYYVRAGEVGEVIQVAGRGGSFGRVLQRLLVDAWRRGATAVRGRVDPRQVQALSEHHCWFRREGAGTPGHSGNPDLAAAVNQGNAFLSRLEGEWWLRFQGG